MNAERDRHKNMRTYPVDVWKEGVLMQYVVDTGLDRARYLLHYVSKGVSRVGQASE